MRRIILLLLAVELILCHVDAQTLPFPQNANYPFGVKPTTINADLAKNEYNKFKSLLVTKCDDALRVIYTDDKTQTRGEGIGFGMILAGYMGDKETFDGLFEFYKKKRTPQAKNMMAWNVTCDGYVDQGSATDVDIDVAYALIVGFNQWGGNYLDEARTIIKLLCANIITTCGGIKTLYPGYSNGAWGGCGETDIQYYTPAFFRVFAKVSGDKMWDTLADDSYTILNNSANDETGLVPDWQTASGIGLPPSYRVAYFHYDACRVPWRMALDYLWNGNEKAKTWCTTISNWAYKIGPANIKDGYNLDGTANNGGNHNSAFVGGFAVSSMCNTQKMADEFGSEMKKISDTYWFNLSTRCLYLFTMTGNFWQPTKFENSTSTGMIKSTDGIKVFPNPSKNGTFTIEIDYASLTENELDIEILNTEGKVVYEDTVCGNETASVDLGQVHGIYILNVKDGDLLYSEKVMVE
jgi:endo-1,4-beta-D-glucanase Y